MLRPPGLQKLVNEQKNSRLRSPLVTNPKSHLRHINWVVIKLRIFKCWIVGGFRLKLLLKKEEVFSHNRLTQREMFLVIILLYMLNLYIIIGGTK